MPIGVTDLMPDGVTDRMPDGVPALVGIVFGSKSSCLILGLGELRAVIVLPVLVVGR